VARDEPNPEGLLARRLEHLFETFHPGKEVPYTPDEVADAINQAAGGEKVISGPYVWMLKTGRRGNPTYRHLIALAQFFGVSPTYFFPETDPGELPREVAAALGSDRLRDLVLRQAGLSDRSLKTISDMVDSARAFDAEHTPRRRGRPSAPGRN
jgi:transcriptional regulator with XRE-family HTH domain